MDADILLVDDNPFNQTLISKQLQMLGYHCDLADDGLQALAMCKDKPYKLVLTDCYMPNMDGFELTQMLRQLEAENQMLSLHIIAITGESEGGDVELKCIETGMNGFTTKPIPMNVLKQLMEVWYV